MLSITSENPYYEDHFERKFQTEIYPSDQSFKKYEETSIKLKEKCHDELRKSSSAPIKNEVITITSEYPYSKDHFEGIFQAKIYPSDQGFKKQEE